MTPFRKIKSVFWLTALVWWLPRPVMAVLDADGNGVSDIWEAMYGPLNAPDDDDDSDGFTNGEEAAAGTDPRDPESRPYLRQVMLEDPARLRNQFSAVPGVRYRVMASADLLTWFPAGMAVSGGEDEVVTHLGGPVVTGDVPLSRWTGLSGGGLGLVKSMATSGTAAQERRITELNVPQSDPNVSEFGQWVRGWILPPESGDYIFWLASDDRSEFWLSTNAAPENLSLVCEITQWTGPDEWEKYPSQRSAPLTLTAGQALYFELFHREYGGGDHLSVAWTLPGRAANERETIGGSVLSSVGLSLDHMLEEHGSLFFRLEVAQVDSDGDGLSDYEEEVLGLDAQRARSKPLIEDLDEAVRILGSENSVTLGVAVPRAFEVQGQSAAFVVFRTGGIEPLSVHYTVSGSAEEGTDFQPLPGVLQIPGGVRSVVLPVVPIPDGSLEAPETVVLTLLSGTNFVLGAPSSATVSLEDAADILHSAHLRPPPGLDSAASGLVTLRRAGNDLGGLLSLSYTGLSGHWQGAALVVSEDGSSGPVILSLPGGQLGELSWDFAPAGGLSREEILLALNEERVWLRLASSAYPDGELRGRLVLGVPPPEPPPPPLPAPTSAPDLGETARFLAQASFGIRADEVPTLSNLVYEAWIDQQLALSPTYHLPYVQERRAEFLARSGGSSDGWQTPRQEAFWQHALTAPDQLRQRMAFALSQILVVSQFGALDGTHEGVTLYYDMLLQHAFGNYRDLLEQVTLSPIMGTYLSMIRNQKPDPDTGHAPDENYARELMQLFTIGLVQLHPDGSPVLDADGRPLPTYSQDDIVALAHVFTGWGPHYDPSDPPRWSNGSVADPDGWFLYGSDRMRPMSFYPQFHDQEDRVLVGGVLIPGELDGPSRLGRALDSLFAHPNVGPFLARNLIQRFVSSNPSPGYVQRVAAVFDDNGSGVRGDLGAVLKAILLDPEARHPHYRQSIATGKADEPVLRFARMFRGLGLQPAKPGDARYFLNYQYTLPEQAPLLSPSVFNFFQPVYQQPGAITQAGLLSPEFQIFSETTGIRQANTIYAALHWGIWTPETDDIGDDVVLRVDFSPWTALLNTPGLTAPEAQNLLLDHLAAVFLRGPISAELRQDVLNAYDALPSWFDYSERRQISRVQMALYLLLTSPEAFVTP